MVYRHCVKLRIYLILIEINIHLTKIGIYTESKLSTENTSLVVPGWSISSFTRYYFCGVEKTSQKSQKNENQSKKGKVLYVMYATLYFDRISHCQTVNDIPYSKKNYLEFFECA